MGRRGGPSQHSCAAELVLAPTHATLGAGKRDEHSADYQHEETDTKGHLRSNKHRSPCDGLAERGLQVVGLVSDIHPLDDSVSEQCHADGRNDHGRIPSSPLAVSGRTQMTTTTMIRITRTNLGPGVKAAPNRRYPVGEVRVGCLQSRQQFFALGVQ
jgi:hypothetical protein